MNNHKGSWNNPEDQKNSIAEIFEWMKSNNSYRWKNNSSILIEKFAVTILILIQESLVNSNILHFQLNLVGQYIWINEYTDLI